MLNGKLAERKFGVEIEVEHLNRGRAAEALTAAGLNASVSDYNHRVVDFWKVTTDGSLSSYETACEVVSPILRGEAGLADVAKVVRALKAAGARVSRATGLHVHLSAEDMSFNDVKRLFCNFVKWESTLGQLVSPSRRNGRFCKSLTQRLTGNDYGRCTTELQKAELANRALARMKTARNFQELRNLIGDRYVALNIECFFRQGTIEFRQHQGTLDARKLVNWIKFCGAMMDASTNRKTVTPIKERDPARQLKVFCAYFLEDPALQDYWTRRGAEFRARAQRTPAATTRPSF